MDTSGVSLVARGAFFEALAAARSVELSAYILGSDGATMRALEAAGERGASVSVTLDGAPYFGASDGKRPNPNLETAAALRAHGVRVRLSDPATEPPMHLKAAVIDGRAFLNDRNWPTSGRATIVETDDPAAARAISAAIAGGGPPTSGRDLALAKADALALEAELIRSAPGDRIDVTTESFGACGVAEALCERARAGAEVRLEVDAHVLAGDVHGREHRTIARLEAAGVHVRAVAGAEKFAVAGDRVWLGSANATSNDGAMLDWGLRSRDGALASTLEDSFERAWARGCDVGAAQPPKSAAAVAEVRVAMSATSSSSSVARYAAVAAM